jgi:hypothetical protein
MAASGEGAPSPAQPTRAADIDPHRYRPHHRYHSRRHNIRTARVRAAARIQRCIRSRAKFVLPRAVPCDVTYRQGAC